jgi:hypothetical protein
LITVVLAGSTGSQYAPDIDLALEFLHTFSSGQAKEETGGLQLMK